jgi:hypothetical protein
MLQYQAHNGGVTALHGEPDQYGAILKVPVLCCALTQQSTRMCRGDRSAACGRVSLSRNPLVLHCCRSKKSSICANGSDRGRVRQVDAVAVRAAVTIRDRPLLLDDEVIVVDDEAMP